MTVARDTLQQSQQPTQPQPSNQPVQIGLPTISVVSP
jgi:hypothetical protein